MRIHELFLVFAIPGTPALAQPVLDAGALSYLPGETFIEQICPWVDEGPAGAGQVWDFSSLSPTASFSSNWIAPLATMQADYPTATVAYNAQSFFGIYEASGTAFRYLGHSEGITLTSSILLDPADEIRYPFAFGDSYTDTFSGWSFFPDGNGQQDSSVVSGTLFVAADAHGELVLPWGVVPEVIRLHKVRITPSASGTVTETEYRFYEPGMHHPWLRTFRRTNSNSTTVTQSARYVVPLGSSIRMEEGTRAPWIAPNPTAGIFTVRAEGIAPGTQINVFDMRGRTVLAMTASMNGTVQLDASRLEDGLYTLSFNAEGLLNIARFIKQ